eukprot:1154663-Pelagomonas_calceolata.AAC.2
MDHKGSTGSLRPGILAGWGILANTDVQAPIVKLVPRESGRGAERVNVLVPLIAQLRHLILDKACIPEC